MTRCVYGGASMLACWLGALMITSGSLAAASAAAAASRARPVLVSIAARDAQAFAPLPACDPNTTIGTVGCLRRKTLGLDRQLDSVAGHILVLGSPASAYRFNAAQRSWLSFRRADCWSQADANEGGTLSQVDAAQCESDVTRRRLFELQAQLRARKPL